MKVENLKNYYNRIDKCSIAMDKQVDFEYIQSQISKISFYTEELNRIIGEILIEITRLEHLLTDAKFEFELKVTENLSNNIQIKPLGTIKEKLNYINYFVLKDEYRNITNLEQELRDSNSLLNLAKKKAKDLDRSYPKLKTLWESVQAEMKYIKKMGSDSEYIEKVKNDIKEEQNDKKPIFTDNLVEQIKSNQYNEDEDSGEKGIFNENVEDLLKDI